MGATTSVCQWIFYLQQQILSGVRKSLSEALGLFSLAMAEARSCQSGRLANAARSPALPASRRRRWERLLANPLVDSAQVQQALGRAVAQRWVAPLALLLMDETACSDRLRCLKVSLAYRNRALPLAWACYRRRPSGGLPCLVRRLLKRAAEALPATTHLVVIADRGLAWPSVIDLCQRQGWSYLLRLQGQTRVRLADRSIQAVADLCRRAGAPAWCGTAQVFKKAGWRTCQIIAQWPRGQQQPWLLVTDQSACRGRWRQYARRMWIEESFRDEKSQGFDWQRSRLTAPERAERLLAVMALAVLLAVSLGSWLIKRGLRHEFDPRCQRRLSLFQLGLLALSNVLNGLRPNWPLQLYFCPS
jgi:hypothetical protein